MDSRKWLTAIETNRELKGLRPVLQSWVKLVKDYCRMDSFEHNPWSYNERASIGTLAGAAWRTPGWLATEEYCTTKVQSIPKSGIEMDGDRRGRCDLLLETSDTTYAIEAKHAWQPISKGASTLLKGMLLALKDANDLTDDEGDQLIAATFTSPYLVLPPTWNGAADLRETRRQVLSWLNENVHGKFHNYAYVFPWQVEQYVSKHGRRLYPGVVLTLAPRGADVGRL